MHKRCKLRKLFRATPARLAPSYCVMRKLSYSQRVMGVHCRPLWPTSCRDITGHFRIDIQLGEEIWQTIADEPQLCKKGHRYG